MYVLRDKYHIYSKESAIFKVADFEQEAPRAQPPPPDVVLLNCACNVKKSYFRLWYLQTLCTNVKYHLTRSRVTLYFKYNNPHSSAWIEGSLTQVSDFCSFLKQMTSEVEGLWCTLEWERFRVVIILADRGTLKLITEWRKLNIKSTLKNFLLFWKSLEWMLKIYKGNGLTLKKVCVRCVNLFLMCTLRTIIQLIKSTQILWYT